MDRPPNRPSQSQHAARAQRKVCTPSVIAPSNFEAVVQAAVRAALAEHVEQLRNIIREEIARAAPVHRPAPNDLDEVLTTVDAGREAKCSEKTIRRACAAGTLLASKPKRMSEWRIRMGDLRNWIASGRMTATTRTRNPEAEGQRVAARMLEGR